MSPLLLFLAAASAAQPAARLQATATARILPGERISFASAAEREPLRAGRRERQHSRFVRAEADGRRAEFRLVEFQ